MKWNFRERMTEFREGFVSVWQRHPLELLLLLALTVTLIVCYETDREPNGARLVVLGWGAMLLLIVNRLAGQTLWCRIYWVAWAPLVPLFLWPGLSDWIDTEQALITLLILTPLALLACRRAVSNERFVADALVYLRSGLLAMLFAYVGYGLFEAILWSAAYIFRFTDAPWVVHLTADLFYVVQFFAVPTLFLMMLDRWEGARFGSSRVLEVLLNWVVTPAVIIYAAILYLYLVKILFTWSLPEGGVAYLVFGFTMTVLLVKALRQQLARRIGDWFYDRLSLLSLPIVALFWVGVARRVGEYGLTDSRIYLLVCGSVMTVCILLFLSRRTGRYLWVVLASMAAFASVAYIPALSPRQAALRSQARRVERIAAGLGRLEESGRLSLAPATLADTLYKRSTANSTRRWSMSSATVWCLHASVWKRRMLWRRSFPLRCVIMCGGGRLSMWRSRRVPSFGSIFPRISASGSSTATPAAMSISRSGRPRSIPSRTIRFGSTSERSILCSKFRVRSC